MLKKIYLHGYLGRMFGKEWILDVDSVKEAIEAINVNTKGKLRNYLSGKGRLKEYVVRLGNYYVSDLKEIDSKCGDNTDIHIIPFIKGRSAVLRIVIGVVLVIIGIVLLVYGQAYGAKFIMAGVSMIVGGIVQMLTPIPNWNYISGDSSQSFFFENGGLLASQGTSVPVVYGRMAINPIPVSVSIITEDRATSDTNNGYGYEDDSWGWSSNGQYNPESTSSGSIGSNHRHGINKNFTDINQFPINPIVSPQYPSNVPIGQPISTQPFAIG
jgi:predicted phage tail protein